MSGGDRGRGEARDILYWVVLLVGREDMLLGGMGRSGVLLTVLDRGKGRCAPRGTMGWDIDLLGGKGYVEVRVI